MKHLKTNYTYLYSMAVRTNPFNPDARIEVAGQAGTASYIDDFNTNLNHLMEL